MSEIKQAAELEAAIAEAELTEEEADRIPALVAEGVPPTEAIALILEERDAEPEPDTPRPAAEPELSEPSAKQIKALDAEQSRHERRVHEIMGGFVEGFEACEACNGVGLVPPGPPPPEPKGHEYFKACDTCNGFGQVRTGSLRAGHEARDCPTCKGRGYLEALSDAGAPLAPADGTTSNPYPTTTAGNENGHAAETAGELTYGTPSWMGDPNLSRA